MTLPDTPDDLLDVVRPLCLCGPTASGKTATALAIAAVLPVEIVSVDSALVYRGMDVGTAKPTPAERAAVPHHLIDIRDPWDPYSAADFASDARRLLADIHARGRHPLLVGGTMLYLKALFDGLDPMPPADPALRAEIDAEAARDGWPALHARLAAVDPETARRLAPADAQRIQRALEVWRASGRPLSDWQRRSADGPAVPRPEPTIVSLEPGDRAWLHHRIAQRLDAMLDAGLLDEVRALRADRRLHADLPAMRAVGYRQCWEALAVAGDGEPDRRMLRERCIAATRQLAKRQLTWLRGLPGRTIVPCDTAEVISRVVGCAIRHWPSP